MHYGKPMMKGELPAISQQLPLPTFFILRAAILTFYTHFKRLIFVYKHLKFVLLIAKH